MGTEFMNRKRGSGPQPVRVGEMNEPRYTVGGPSIAYAGSVRDGHDSGPAFTNINSIENASRREQYHRFAGLAVGLASVVAEHVLSHPCIVLRRQCQVHHNSHYYHLTPFTLFQPAFNIQTHQSVATLWKGIGSTLMTKGIGLASESLISEFTPLPKEINKHSSLKKQAGHLLLKSLGYLVVTPFYASSLVETVQSEVASERPGVFDCLREGLGRLMSLNTPQTTRLLPIWQLFLPTVCHGVMHYVITSLAQYTVSVSLRAELTESKGGDQSKEESSLYETYYPELIATFTGNLLADTMLFPLETVLHRLHLQGTRTIIDNTDTGLGVVPLNTRYEGLTDCFLSIISEEGLSGLYKGFGALVLQYGIHMALLKMSRFLFKQLLRDMRSRSLPTSQVTSPQREQPARVPPDIMAPAYDSRYRQRRQ